MNSQELGKTLIIGSCFTQKSFKDAQQIIKSSYSKASDIDYITSGYTPEQNSSGVLYSFKDCPLAYWGIPTLNNMVFSRNLWESLLANPFIKATLESKSLWGEDRHNDSSEIFLTNVACRVNNWRCVDNNFVIGDLDIMDTPNGLICYTLAKTGRIGNSSRGFGDLRPRGNGLSDVVESEYQHVSWDCVAFPAVPNCVMTLAEQSSLATDELGSLSQELRRLVGSALDRNPDNPLLIELNSLLTGKYENDRAKAHQINLKNSTNRLPTSVIRKAISK